MSAGYSGTPLARKLGIKEDQTVATVGAPAHFPSLLRPLPARVRLEAEPDGGGPYPVVVAFIPEASVLEDRFRRGQELMDPYGGLWLAWPKQSSALATELRESHIREHGLATGLVDNKICAVDADWSGLRFVVRVEDRPPRDASTSGR